MLTPIRPASPDLPPGVVCELQYICGLHKSLHALCCGRPVRCGKPLLRSSVACAALNQLEEVMNRFLGFPKFPLILCSSLHVDSHLQTRSHAGGLHNSFGLASRQVTARPVQGILLHADWEGRTARCAHENQGAG